MASVKVNSFSVDEIDTIYWFDPYTNEKLNEDDFELTYLFGITITTLHYYDDARAKGTLTNISLACTELHNAFVRMCKHLKMTPTDIDILERSIF